MGRGADRVQTMQTDVGVCGCGTSGQGSKHSLIGQWKVVVMCLVSLDGWSSAEGQVTSLQGRGSQTDCVTTSSSA